MVEASVVPLDLLLEEMEVLRRDSLDLLVDALSDEEDEPPRDSLDSLVDVIEEIPEFED